jgi:hypothetical protein
MMLQHMFVNRLTLSAATACAAIVVVCAGTVAMAAVTDDNTAPEKPPEQAEHEKQADDRSAPPTLDDLLGLEEEAEDRGAEEAAQREHQRELERRLAEERITDAFEHAIAQMSLSAELLDEQFDPGLGTQRIQEDIIAKLDQLIEEARQQGMNSSSSSSSSQASADPRQSPGQQGGQPQSQEADAGEGENLGETDLPPGRQGDINVVMDETREEWGALPDRIRDMLLQGRQERFSGLYEQLTREYYRRLAED